MNQAHIVMDIRNSLRMNQREIADYLGVSPSVISNVESGARQISKSLQALLVEKLNVNPSYLLTGEGPMFAGQEIAVQPTVPTLGIYRGGGMRELPEVLNGKLVPFLTQMVSAGPGAELQEYEDSCGLICLPEAAVKGELRALRVKGDSMEPTLRPGDIVVCDQNGWQGDGVYVIRDQDSAYVKRVRRVREGLEVISDNTAYKPWSCPSEELVLVGRVVFCVVRL